MKLKDFPILYHCHDADPGWDEFLRYAHKIKVPACIADDVTFVTYNNHSEPCLAENVMNRNGLAHVTVAKEWPNPWTMWGKVIPVANFLRACSTPLVGLCDGNDGFALPSPNIRKRFEAFGCDVLLCATPYYYPPDKDDACKDFELETYSGFLKPHLSAGAYFGRTEVILQILEEMIAGYDHFNREFHRFSDQRLWRRKHRELYPRIKVDVQEKLLARYDSIYQNIPKGFL